MLSTPNDIISSNIKRKQEAVVEVEGEEEREKGEKGQWWVELPNNTVVPDLLVVQGSCYPIGAIHL